MLHHTGWLVLLVHLPPRPIGLRVRVWRRLKGMGAVALKPSAYVLPDAAEQREQFEWLSQEMEKAGGQATLLQVARIERLSAADLRALFHAARGREYQEVAGKYKALLTRAGRTAPRARAGLDTARRRLAGELARIRRIDFFDAPQYHDVKRLSETLDMHLKEPTAAAGPRAAPLDPRAYRGKRWVTRPRPHVDRIATAWLIRKFIDPAARFVFAAPGAFPKGAIPFDAPGVELGHQGPDCTFETVLKRFRLTQPALKALAEVVHDVDLDDDRFARAEAQGLDAVLRGLRATHADDHDLLEAGMPIFEGLYATLASRRR